MLIYRLDAEGLMVSRSKMAPALTYDMQSSSGETEAKNGGCGRCHTAGRCQREF